MENTGPTNLQQGQTSPHAFQQYGQARGYGQGKERMHAFSQLDQQQWHGQSLASLQQGQERSHISQEQGKRECVSLMGRDKGLDKYNRVLESSNQIKHLFHNSKD